MKIVFIGMADGLAEALIERMTQEGNDVYLLSDKDLSKSSKRISQHRFYRSPRRGKNFEQLLHSIAPDCVIFAGPHYLYSKNEKESDENVTVLAASLRAASDIPNVKFILLSSTEVYGDTVGAAQESAPLTTTSKRGIQFLREEELVDIFRKRYDINTVILRASHIYTNQPKDDACDFLSRSFSATAKRFGSLPNDIFQPLHASDLADAVKRVIDDSKHPIYNVCSSVELPAKRLYELLYSQQGLPMPELQWETSSTITFADNSLIRQELGWTDFHLLEEQLQKGQITYKQATQKRPEKKHLIPRPLRQTIENIIIFLVFFALDYASSSSTLFSQIDWMMIYVILVAITYNIYQSALAAGLASITYIYHHFMQSAQMGSFYSYAEGVLAVAEFVFLGLVVSYTIEKLRDTNRSVQQDLKLVQEEYDDLKAINDENVLIKNEYEVRLLTSKTGFPKLYDLISRLMVQEPDRIFMETMHILSELVRTNTVAVYQGQPGSPWLRLVAALNDESTMDGKTWNLSDRPHLFSTLQKGELYQGRLGTDEPAVVLPIMCENAPLTVILIKKLPYECESLYYMNLLKTMSLLLRDAIEKAFQYESLSRSELYVEGTDILKPEAFSKRVQLAEEMAEKNMAEYCVIELISSSNLEHLANKISNTLRMTDYLGIDEHGKLYALLSNTGSENLEHLKTRLANCGVDMRIVTNTPKALPHS